MEATEFAHAIKVLLAPLCITLIFMHAFAFSRVSKMGYSELPLWFFTSRVPRFFVYAIACLTWPILSSGVIWSFVALRWWIALIVIAASLILASIAGEKMPPMLTVLLTGLPSLLLAVMIWLV